MEIPPFAGENLLGREGPAVIVPKSNTVSRCHARIVVTRGAPSWRFGEQERNLRERPTAALADAGRRGPSGPHRVAALHFRPSQPAGPIVTVASQSTRRSDS
jgi:hypothetical protein